MKKICERLYLAKKTDEEEKSFFSRGFVIWYLYLIAEHIYEDVFVREANK